MTEPNYGRARMLWLVAAMAALVLALGACGDDDDDGGGEAEADAGAECQAKYEVPGAEDGTLKVGVIQYPPYSSVTDGEAGGIDGEIMAQFAEEACLDVEVSETTFAAAVSSITSGRNDVAMGDLYRTKERAAEVALTDPVYLDQPSIISREGIDTIEGLTGKKIATVQGYYFVEDVTKVFGDDVQLFPDNIKMYQDVIAGRSDAGLDSAPAAIEYLKSQGVDDEFQVEVPPSDPRVAATGAETAQSGFAYNDEVAGLGEALNAYLADLRESGELARIVGEYGLPESAADVGPARLL
jgi:polar amino acid transport system substrate-binding protein